MERIAVGGMAEMYLAKMKGAEGFEKRIAIKMILPHLSEEEELVHFFVEEAKLAALLNHQNIVQIYDFGSVEGSYFIAMEYLDGKDLQAVQKRAGEEGQAISLENALHIGSQVCAGLDYAHNLKDYEGKSLDLIHRDVSPPNVILTYEGEVKIVDFGIAKATGYSRKTPAGSIKGKVAYMSPEQARGEVIGRCSDVFASGILLYEMVTGRRMFEGDTFEVLEKVKAVVYEPPENIIRGLPPRLCHIMHRALEKDANRRYPSCGDMRSDLEDLIEQLSFRPSNRGLAQYMKELFRDQGKAPEVGGERVDLSKPSGESPVEEKTYEKTRVVEEEAATVIGHPQRRFVFWGILAAFGLLGMVLIYAFQTKELEGPEKKALTRTEPQSVEKASVKALVTATPDSTEITPTATEAARVNEAMTALKENRYEKAVTLFETVLKSAPGMVNQVSGPYAQALSGRASDLLKTDPDGAESRLLKAMDLDPTSVEAHFQLGLLYVKRKDYPKAIETYKKVAELDPLFPDTFFNMGYVYAMTKDYAEAEHMYGRVVDLNPPFVDEALFNMALIQDKLGKRTACIENLKKAVEVNPENAPARHYLTRIEKASGDGK